MKSQTDLLEDCLLGGDCLTSLDIIRICGTVNPTARISELRAKLHDKLKDRPLKLSSGKRVKQYYIERKNIV